MTCDCDDTVVMSRDVRMRCDRVRARFRAANNLACHGMYYTEQQSDVEVVCWIRPVADSDPQQYYCSVVGNWQHGVGTVKGWPDVQ